MSLLVVMLIIQNPYPLADGPFKLTVSVNFSRNGFIAMNEALKKEAEAEVTEKLVQKK